MNDAYFKLVRYVFEISQQYIEPVGYLVVNGYVTFQMISIRRLCDERKDVISLRRLLLGTKSILNQQALLKKLDTCNELCNRASDHIAHTGNPARRPNITDWNVTEDDLTSAQKTICEVGIALDRVSAKPKGYVKIIPVANTLNFLQFNLSNADLRKVIQFWHAQNETVNAWVYNFP